MLENNHLDQLVLNRVCTGLGIPLFGRTEDDGQGQAARAAYSLAARRLLASLWDVTELAQTNEVSVTHAKRAFLDTYRGAQSLWLDKDHQLPEDKLNKLAAALFEQYVDCGFLYHRNNYVSSAPLKWASANNAAAQIARGIGPGFSVQMAGALPVLRQPADPLPPDRRTSLGAFFGKPPRSPRETWEATLRLAHWSDVPPEELTHYEFLELTHFDNHYWTNTISGMNAGSVSIARDARLRSTYFLCRKTPEDRLQFSDLNNLSLQDLRSLALKALRLHGTRVTCRAKRLPTPTVNGNCLLPFQCSQVSWSYLPTPWLHNALCLSGWPVLHKSEAFCRIIPDDVLQQLLPYLEEEGFLVYR